MPAFGVIIGSSAAPVAKALAPAARRAEKRPLEDVTNAEAGPSSTRMRVWSLNYTLLANILTYLNILLHPAYSEAPITDFPFWGRICRIERLPTGGGRSGSRGPDREVLDSLGPEVLCPPPLAAAAFVSERWEPSVNVSAGAVSVKVSSKGDVTCRQCRMIDCS
ncbi:hypothetical protein B0H19DRAFT_1071417 [Mycena capillaripes]|nr:hypothetical protein B0H19DRAFT_1071417 [Mycena capillaripes]